MNANSPPAAATETDVTTSATTTLATPPRHNYAATNTPIASSKRPRANTKSSSNTSPHPSSAATPAEASLSPMHPPRAAVVIVAAPDLDASSGAIMEESSQQDELFSPHLHVALPHHSAHSHNHTSDSDVESLQGIAEHSNDNDEDNNDEDDFNPWQFIQSLPPYSHVSHLVPACTIPPKRPDDTRLTLVLDLDETLVHCTTESVQDCDFTFAVVFHGTSYQVHVKLRPYLQKFLEAIENKYEVIVFTASQKVYADQVRSVCLFVALFTLLVLNVATTYTGVRALFILSFLCICTLRQLLNRIDPGM
jgi:TFIIF-interacting CTD phosphatase-like protein